MHYGRGLAVQVFQTYGHIAKDGTLHVARQTWVHFKTLSKGHWEVLHDDGRYCRICIRCVDTNELNNVGMLQLAVKETLGHKAVN